jgi:hypothetical protein
MTKKIAPALCLLAAAAAPAAAQTVLYDNTTILVNANNEPFLPDTESPITGTGVKAYLEDVTVAAAGQIGVIEFSAFNAGDLVGGDVLSCFGNTSFGGQVSVYRDPDGAGPDADCDGVPDPDRLAATADFFYESLPCGATVEDVMIASVDIADQNVSVAAGDRLFIRVLLERDFFRQVQAGPAAVGSTANGYWLADPTIDPPDSGVIRSGDPDANLYLKITAAAPAPACPCERDGAPGVNVFDLLAYLDGWFAQDAAADIDETPGVDVFDLLAYLDCWFPASAGEACA